jgi:hypothetical protein
LDGREEDGGQSLRRNSLIKAYLGVDVDDFDDLFISIIQMDVKLGLRVFENRLLRSKSEKVTGWKKLINKY